MAFFTRFKPSRASGVSNDAPSLVQPQFKDSCEIGNMIRRALSGDSSVFGNPTFINALGAPDDFADAQFRLATARTVWEDLPDHIKQSYGSPAQLLADLDKALTKRNSISDRSEKLVEKPVDKSDSTNVTPKGDVPSTGAACA